MTNIAKFSYHVLPVLVDNQYQILTPFDDPKEALDFVAKHMESIREVIRRLAARRKRTCEVVFMSKFQAMAVSGVGFCLQQSEVIALGK